MSRSFFVFRPSESELPFASYRARKFGVQKWRFVINKPVTANYFANSNNFHPLFRPSGGPGKLAAN
jgi:hypothetical protein